MLSSFFCIEFKTWHIRPSFHQNNTWEGLIKSLNHLREMCAQFFTQIQILTFSLSTSSLIFPYMALLLIPDITLSASRSPGGNSFYKFKIVNLRNKEGNLCWKCLIVKKIYPKKLSVQYIRIYKRHFLKILTT